MRARLTLTELSVERRDSKRIVRSREANCACWAAERRGRDRLATLFAFVFEIWPARVELAEGLQASIQLAAGTRKSLLRDADFASDVGCFRFETTATKCRFLRAGAHGFELTEQLAVLTVRTLNAGLRGIALALGISERLTDRAEMLFRRRDALFRSVEIRAQRLEAMLALDDATTRIFATADAQPVTTEPFALPRDDRLAIRQRRASGQRFSRATPQ